MEAEAVPPPSETDADPCAPPPAIDPEVITVDEGAALLRLDRKTLYEDIVADKIPGVRRFGKTGRTIRIHRPTLLAWLAGQERASRPKGRSR